MALSDCLKQIQIEQDVADFMQDRSDELVDSGIDQLTADRQVIAEMFQDIEATLVQIESRLKINRDGSPKEMPKTPEFAGEVFNKPEVPEEKKPIEIEKPTEQPTVTPKVEVPAEEKKEQPSQDIAKANAQVDTNPTEAQKEAGNYQKGHLRLAGFDVSIEIPAGSTRSGVDRNGKEWSMKLNNSYGYLRRTEGKDGDQMMGNLSSSMSIRSCLASTHHRMQQITTLLTSSQDGMASGQ
jgi:hypothetical protein